MSTLAWRDIQRRKLIGPPPPRVLKTLVQSRSVHAFSFWLDLAVAVIPSRPSPSHTATLHVTHSNLVTRRVTADSRDTTAHAPLPARSLPNPALHMRGAPVGTRHIVSACFFSRTYAAAARGCPGRPVSPSRTLTLHACATRLAPLNQPRHARHHAHLARGRSLPTVPRSPPNARGPPLFNFRALLALNRGT